MPFLESGGCNSSSINTIFDPHFTEEGILIPDSTDTNPFTPLQPSQLKFYVEVSGSMNGFFRANQPTDFKTDVWEILSYYSPIIDEVTTLTNAGDTGASMPLSEFQTMMNTGRFVSTASTKIPLMLESIISNLDADAGEVAVLISDMKYDPVGSAAPKVLQTMFSTDISNVLGKAGEAVCLIGATSSYLDRSGKVAFDRSPYYYFIIGNDRQVADVRNAISTLLENRGHFIDNIESGFDYGHPIYSFGIPSGCFQMDDVNPTFVGYDSSADSCTVKLKVSLENYRWLMQDERNFEEAFSVKSLYGSEVSFDIDDIDVQNITDKKLDRHVTATVNIQLSHMPTDSEVLEWNLQLPDTEITKFSPYLGADSPNDVTKTYSLEDFIRGMFYLGVVNQKLKPNYILISKNTD